MKHDEMTNPYIELANHYKNRIQEDAYRQNRNHKQLGNLRFNPKINIDTVLAGKDEDDRLGCCIVARPTENVKSLISSIQDKLLESVSNSSALWHTPSEYLHMTVLEIDNSSTKNRIKEINNILLPHIDRLMTITENGPELDNPLICFDANAIALSFTSVDRSHQTTGIVRLNSLLWYRHTATLPYTFCAYYHNKICRRSLCGRLDDLVRSNKNNK